MSILFPRSIFFLILGAVGLTAYFGWDAGQPKEGEQFWCLARQARLAHGRADCKN